MTARGGPAMVGITETKGDVMSVVTIAGLEGEPRAVFSALEHHWADHAPARGLLERTVAHGADGFMVIETWETEADATAAWSVVRLEGIPSPEIRVYGVVARSGPTEVRDPSPTWAELALPDDAVWDERVVPRDS
jgi:hypothetical protein